MKARELKDILQNIDDDADVLLYDGLDEGDVFCTIAAQIDANHYIGSCKGGSCTDDDCDATKFFVLAGFGTTYNTLDNCSNGKDLYMISDGPEAEASKIAAENAFKEARVKAAEERARRQAKLDEDRKRRYCVNWGAPGHLDEKNFDNMDEVKAYVDTIDTGRFDFVVFDRVQNICIWKHIAKKG